jgi:hypothetical protein
METPRMKMLNIKKLSPAVMSRIRNGHKVRLMEGTGTQLVVHPDQFDSISRSFSKKKGIQIALSPSEIDANRVVEGEGIFGKKADKVMKKLGVKKVAYAVGNVVKPLVQEGIAAASMAAQAYGLPPSVANKLESTANQYLDDPKSLQGKKGLRALKKSAIDMGIEAAAPMAAQYGIDLDEMKSVLQTVGTKKAGRPPSKKEMQSMVRGKAEGAVLGKLQQMVDSRRSASAPMPVSTDLYSQFDQDGIIGNGMRSGCCQMCKGSGLYAGAASGRGLPGMPPMRSISKKFVNVSKKLMGGELQALSSQPMEANYAFRYAR